MTRLRLLLFAFFSLLAAWPAAAADKLVVGAIYVGSINDYGYNRSMHDGLMAMKAAHSRRHRARGGKRPRDRPKPNASWKA